jgi:uncharacterized protein (TIGR02594 family)
MSAAAAYSLPAMARDVAEIKRTVVANSRRLAVIEAITHVTWSRTRPQMEWYFALPVAAMAYLMVLSPLRTAGKDISPYVDMAFTATSTAAEDVGAWLASLSFAMPSMYHGQSLRGLSNEQTGALMAALGQRENSGRYEGWNSYGYLGKYQGGASALAQTGYIRAEVLENADNCIKGGACGKLHLEFLQDNSHWTDGNSFEQFMGTPEIQDEFFVKLANFNIEQGFKRGVLHEGEYGKIAGFVAVAHLQGIETAVDYFLHGEDTQKGGAYASEYASIGANAVKATGVLATATRFIGMREDTNNRQLSAFMAKAGMSIDPDVSAWCAGFVNAVLHENGMTGTGLTNARSFLNWGVKTDSPKPGDIVVLWRGSRDGWKGHVGLFNGFDGAGNVLILGGNQNDQVSVEAFPASRVLGYRTPDKKFI